MSITLLPGQQRALLLEPSGIGTIYRDFSIQSDAVFAGLVVHSLVGTITVNIYANVDGQQSLLVSFGTVSVPTTTPLLRRSSITTAVLRAEVIISPGGTADYQLDVRAVGAGVSDTKILGAEGWKVSQRTVGTSAIQLVATSINDRSGMLIKNWSSTQTVYVAETLAKATTGTGYPLAPKDAIAMDIAAGAEVYAVSDAAGADLRITEAGG